MNSNNQRQNNKNNDIYSSSSQQVEFHQSANVKKGKKPFSRIALSLGVLIILAGTVATISISEKLNNPKAETPANAETSVTLDSKENKNSSSNKVSSSVEESSSPAEPEKPKYSTNAKFIVNTKRLPKEMKAELDEQITSEFVVLYDLTSDEIIYEKNSNKKCYPASTTKMLTAIVASSIIKDKDTEITVGNEIELIGAESSTAGLQIGDKLTFEMLLDALMLPSGNDAAYTVAVNTARIYKNDPSISNKEAVSIFMDLVNDAAKQITATDTHFTTPDGWHDDNHYTTAADLAKIATYLRTVPIVKQSASKAYAEWEFLSGGTAVWYNSNKLILGDSGYYSPYVDGIKTGFTDEAGTSVVASASMDGHTLIAVVMNADSLYKKYEEAHLLFTSGFNLYNLEYTHDG